MRHELKTWPAPYQAVADGRKTFEFRKDDRGFAVGDILRLREWDPERSAYTTAERSVVVRYLVRGPAFGVPDGYVVMAIEDGADPKPRHETGVMQFGDDWPGVFIRGDNAAMFAITLRKIEAIDLGAPERQLDMYAVRDLAEILESCDTRRLRKQSER